MMALYLQANPAVVYKCTWPGCLEIKATVPLIEDHVRQSHLGYANNTRYNASRLASSDAFYHRVLSAYSALRDHAREIKR